MTDSEPSGKAYECVTAEEDGFTLRPAPHEHHPLTDSGNAERFRDQWGHCARYVQPLKAWLYWNGRHWQPDTRGVVDQLAKLTARSFDEDIRCLSDEDTELRKRLRQHATKAESRAGRETRWPWRGASLRKSPTPSTGIRGSSAARTGRST